MENPLCWLNGTMLDMLYGVYGGEDRALDRPKHMFDLPTFTVDPDEIASYTEEKV